MLKGAYLKYSVAEGIIPNTIENTLPGTIDKIRMVCEANFKGSCDWFLGKLWNRQVVFPPAPLALPAPPPPPAYVPTFCESAATTIAEKFQFQMPEWTSKGCYDYCQSSSYCHKAFEYCLSGLDLFEMQAQAIAQYFGVSTETVKITEAAIATVGLSAGLYFLLRKKKPQLNDEQKEKARKAVEQLLQSSKQSIQDGGLGKGSVSDISQVSRVSVASGYDAQSVVGLSDAEQVTSDAISQRFGVKLKKAERTLAQWDEYTSPEAVIGRIDPSARAGAKKVIL